MKPGDRIKSKITGKAGTVTAVRPRSIGAILTVKYDDEDTLVDVASPFVTVIFPYREEPVNTNSVDYIVENTYGWRETL